MDCHHPSFISRDLQGGCRAPKRFRVSAFLIIAFVLLTGCEPEPVAQYGHSNSEVRHFDTYEEIAPENLSSQLSAKVFGSAGEADQIRQETDRQFLKFVQAIERHVRDGESSTLSTPAWVSDSFSGQGVKWDALKPRFEDPSIKISRWQSSPEAPRFEGEDAFKEFVGNYFQGWMEAKDFRVDVKPYSARPLPESEGEIETSVVVEVFGHTGEGGGLQATSLWTTQWKKTGAGTADRLELTSIVVRAQEQVTLTTSGGQLFEDYTEAILSRTDLLDTQLSFGLDQWARKIPGLDIVGHHGLSIGDVNEDGLDDIYVCQPHGLPNLLLIQNPDGTVEDMGQEAGVDILDESRGSLMVDVDNDGDQDLVVTTDQGLVLMSNKGKGDFQLEHELTIGHSGHSVSAADYDQDGDLDLFICKYSSEKNYRDLVSFPDSFDKARSGGRNILLRNDEGWNFVDVTADVGFGAEKNSRFSRSAVWSDYDLDGDLDLFVANEWAADQLFNNDRGWFHDVTEELGMVRPAQHRTVSTGEFNLDGKPDFFVATDAPLMLYQTLAGGKPVKDLSSARQTILGEDQIWFSKQQPDGDDFIDSFQAFSLRAPIFAAETAYSSVAADLNNDGLDDVIVTNGHLSRSSSEDLGGMLASASITPRESRKQIYQDGLVPQTDRENSILSLARSGYSLFGGQRNRCYLSIGKLGFANFSCASGVDFMEDGRAVATTDWDGDGDIDIIMTSRNGPRMRILLNQNPPVNNFLQFKLVGTRSNLDAIGSRVELFVVGRDAPLVKFVTAGSGNLSQSSKRLFFGLGQQNKIQKAIVTWPDGQQQTYTDLVPNTRYTATEGDDLLAERSSDRFKIEGSPAKIVGKLTLPNRDVATFSPTGFLPNIQFQDEEGHFQKVTPLNESFTTVVFFDDGPHSRSVLKELNANASNYRSETMDCVGIHIASKVENQEQRFEAAQKFFTDQDFHFRWGAGTQATEEKLTHLNGEWFSHQQLPQLPFAVLLNGIGRVERLHWLTASKSPDKLVEYLNADALKRHDHRGPTIRNDEGVWLARYRQPDMFRLVARFDQIGLEETSRIMFELNRPNSALRIAQFASDLLSENDVKRATKFFDRALQLNPRCVPALVSRGAMIRAEAHKLTADELPEKLLSLQRAAQSYQRASEIDPLCTSAIIGRTEVLIDQNNTTEAINELQRYLAISPQRAEVHAILGRLFFATREFKESAKSFLTAYELRPNLPYVAGDLGYLYLCSGEIVLGRKFLRLANRLQPSEPNILKHLAEAEFVNGNFPKAVELLGKSIDSNPNKRRPKELMAWLLATSPFEEIRNGARGQEMTEALLLMAGDRSPSTFEICAACFAENSDFESAVSYQEKAIELIRSGKTLDTYTPEQKVGMVSRLELYQRKKPYRMENLKEIPIKTSLKKVAKK